MKPESNPADMPSNDNDNESAIPTPQPGATITPGMSPNTTSSPTTDSLPQTVSPTPTPTPSAPTTLPIAQPLQPPVPPGGMVNNPELAVIEEELEEAEANPTLQHSLYQKFFAGKGKLYGAIAAGLVVLGLAVGGVFGYYLPNTPDSVWKTGLQRTGAALETVVQSATEETKLAAYNTTTISGSVAAKYGNTSYGGTFSTKFDASTSNNDIKADITDKDGKKQTVSVKALSEIAPDKKFPDIYLQVTGLKTLGVDAFIPGLSEYDGKWITITSEYLESLGVQVAPQAENTKTDITAKDISALARSITSVTNDYVFTTDSDKAVLVKKSFVGKENIDGLAVNHYKAGITITNAKAYCSALSDTFLSSGVYKKLANPKSADLDETKAKAKKECATSVEDRFSESDTFDVWVDSKRKLIYKVRVYEKSDTKSYTEIGQHYTGGDTLALFANWHADKEKRDVSLTVKTNLKSNATSGTLSVEGGEGEEAYNVLVKVDAKLTNEAVSFTKPSPTTAIEDVLAKFGLAPPSVDTTAQGGDAERKADINSLRSYLEAYHASSGTYPTLDNFNNADWRKTNMPALTDSALSDPVGKTTVLVATPNGTQYGYATTGCTVRSCGKYTLLAKLSDGTIYSVTSN